MKKIVGTGLILAGISYALSRTAGFETYGNVSLTYFLPGEFVIFLISVWLSKKLGPILEQPPMIIFLVMMVVKILTSLILLLIYLINKLGPANPGAAVFILIYLIFEIMEIIRFLHILRPDSGRNAPE